MQYKKYINLSIDNFNPYNNKWPKQWNNSLKNKKNFFVQSLEINLTKEVSFEWQHYRFKSLYDK